MSSLNAQKLATYTVKIETQLGQRPNPGTAFFLDLRTGTNSLEQFLITARHIIDNASSCVIYLSRMERGQRSSFFPKDIQLPCDLNNWKPHPNRTIDLAALPIRKLLEDFEKDFELSLYRPTITEDMIVTPEDLSGMGSTDEVLVIGYPNNLYDIRRNLSVFSKGIASTHPGLNFDDGNAFLIDAACFQGSSGAPVFSYDSLKSVEFCPKLLGVVSTGVMGKITIEKRQRPDRRLGTRRILGGIPDLLARWRVIEKRSGGADSQNEEMAVGFPISFSFVIRAEELLGFRGA